MQCVVRNRAICSGLSPEELQLLSQLGRRHELERGQTLLWEGEESVVVANVIAGVLKISMSLSDGREQIVGVVFPSDFIGRAYGATLPYTVTALSAAELCVFPRAAFERFAADHPALGDKLLQRTLDELDRAREWMLLLGKKAASERIATLLLELSTRLAASTCAHAGAALDRFEIPLDRQQMGDLLGLTIETVSRQLTRLKGEGVIALPDRRSVVIQDRAALEDMAQAA